MNDSSSNRTNKYGGFSNILKNIFFGMLILQFAPSVISSIKDGLEEAFYPKSQVGCLNITGLIRDSRYYTKRLEEFEKNSSIKALLVKIDSPGGYPGSSQAIFRELLKFKKKKPVVVWVENVCASGGYYIACAANKIIANPSSVVGSIGVMGVVPNVKELLNSWNIKVHHVQSGKYKTAGSPSRELTPEEMEYLQSSSDDIYEQFIKDVAQNRGLIEKDYEQWADGKVYTGNKALQLRLIDQVGAYSDAVDMIKKLANIKDEIKFVTIQKSSGGLLSRLFMGEEELGAEISSVSDMSAQVLSNASHKFFEQQLMQKATMTL